MANRSTGQIILNANFEVGYLGPLDARVTTPELAHLTNPDSGAAGTYLPLPYPGMLVAVTDDPNDNNGDINGLYLLTGSDASQTSSWTKISADQNAYISSVSDADGVQTITMSDGTQYTTTFETIRLFEFTGNTGVGYKVNDDSDY